MSLEEMMKPKPLDYYRAYANADYEYLYGAEVSLTIDQQAAILKAHDHGIAKLEPEEVALLDQVMSKLKERIWP